MTILSQSCLLTSMPVRYNGCITIIRMLFSVLEDAILLDIFSLAVY